jgi:hypothetical protein
VLVVVQGSSATGPASLDFPRFGGQGLVRS